MSDTSAVGQRRGLPLGAPLAPIIRNRPAQAAGPIFKTVVFNARGGKQFAPILERLLEPPLKGASVILLCELDWRLPRSGMREVAAELAERLGMSFAYGPEFAFSRGEPEFKSSFGNALLSAVPLKEVEAVPLTLLYDWTKRRLAGSQANLRRIGRRSCLVGKIMIGGRELDLAVAHLENRASPASREKQMREVLAALPDSGPAIIGGDFNTTTIDLTMVLSATRLVGQLVRAPRRLRDPEPYEPLFVRLREAGFEVAGANMPLAPTYTSSSLLPRLLRPKLDWVAFRELKPVVDSAAVVSASTRWGRRLSDHDFLVCDFEL